MARTGVFGQSGMGKSWWFGWYLENVIPKFEYAVHIDIEDEERGLSPPDDPLLHTFYVDKQFLNQRVQYQNREMPLLQAVILDQKKIRVVPDSLTPDEKQEILHIVSDLSMKVGQTDADFHISADEAQGVLPASGVTERVTRMLSGGRKKGVEWAFCTQRPVKLHEEAYTQMNYAVYFQVSKDNDLAKVGGSCGFNARQKLPQLTERQALIEDIGGGNLKEIDTNNLSRTYPHKAGDDGKADEVLMG